MIDQVVHEKADTVDATRPEGTALALTVAEELHCPSGPALPVAAVPELMGLRTPATRPHRHKVPLRRLTTMAA
ncbi:hypothetical protein [Streptomyces mexicanus]|uniref:hypothetical protein n=1 Tax=Streptomyces mexicanus TaxID=178566 RepID=UPI0036A858F1